MNEPIPVAPGNLYRFLALSGLVLFLFAAWTLVSMARAHNEALRQAEEERSQIRRVFGQLALRASSQDAEDVAARAPQRSWMDRAGIGQGPADSLVEEMPVTAFSLFALLLGGALLFWRSARLWYQRVQRLLDSRLAADAAPAP